MASGILLLLTAMLAGCMHSVVYKLPMTNASVAFQVVDNRPDTEKRFRYAPLEIPRRDVTNKYGDEQFSVNRLQALAEHLATAFPSVSSSSKLIVNRFEVHSALHKTVDDARRSGAALAAVSPVAAMVAQARYTSSPLKDLKTCELKGSFDGIEFDTYRELPIYNSYDPEWGVPLIIKQSFEDVVEQIKARRKSE